LVVLLAVLIVSPGCSSNYHWRKTVANDTSVVNSISRKVDEPQVEIMQAALTSAPITMRDRDRLESLTYLDLTVRQTLEIAMQNSQVLRELGGVASEES
jgi:hypothetical protein